MAQSKIFSQFGFRSLSPIHTQVQLSNVYRTYAAKPAIILNCLRVNSRPTVISGHWGGRSHHGSCFSPQGGAFTRHGVAKCSISILLVISSSYGRIRNQRERSDTGWKPMLLFAAGRRIHATRSCAIRRMKKVCNLTGGIGLHMDFCQKTQ